MTLLLADDSARLCIPSNFVSRINGHNASKSLERSLIEELHDDDSVSMGLNDAQITYYVSLMLRPLFSHFNISEIKIYCTVEGVS